MKKMTTKIMTVLLAVTLISCEKDVLEEPLACFTSKQDTIYKNEYVRFYICSDAMFNTVFSGDFLSEFNGIDSINGQGYFAPEDSIDIKYIKTGEFQPWLLSTNWIKSTIFAWL